MELNENLFLEYTEDTETEYAHDNGWKKVDSKEVKDSDGFMTEYTWYTNDAEDTHIFIFGDSDIYGPDDSYADAEFDSYDLAKEWFDNYYGFDYDEEDPDWVEFAEDRPADDLEEEIRPNIESEELKALAQKHNIKILDAMSNGDLRMEGAGADLMKFYQEAEKLGLWEVDPSLYESKATGQRGRYQVEVFDEGAWHKLNSWSTIDKAVEAGEAAVEAVYQDYRVIDKESGEPVELEEALTMHNFDEFKTIADEVGLKTAEDLERFRKEEMQPGESELDAIKRYKQELIDAGVDLSTLVNESVVKYPNRMEVTDVDLDIALSYMYGTDRDMDNSKYTDDEKQRAVTYWVKKTDPSPYENLNEGAVKEVAMDIEAKEKELKDLRVQLSYLKSYDRKECGAGGQFDSTAELDAEISDTETSIEKLEKELEELQAKVNA